MSALVVWSVSSCEGVWVGVAGVLCRCGGRRMGVALRGCVGVGVGAGCAREVTSGMHWGW